MSLLIGIAGTVLYVVAIVFYVRYACRKSDRDYEAMQRSNLEYAEWMVNFGRMVEKFEREDGGDRIAENNDRICL